MKKKFLYHMYLVLSIESLRMQIEYTEPHSQPQPFGQTWLVWYTDKLSLRILGDKQ